MEIRHGTWNERRDREKKRQVLEEILTAVAEALRRPPGPGEDDNHPPLRPGRGIEPRWGSGVRRGERWGPESGGGLPETNRRRH
jgi:hypothetical protein